MSDDSNRPLAKFYPFLFRQPTKIEEDDLKNEDNPKNEEDHKNEDNHQNEADPLIEHDLKNWRRSQK